MQFNVLKRFASVYRSNVNWYKRYRTCLHPLSTLSTHVTPTLQSNSETIFKICRIEIEVNTMCARELARYMRRYNIHTFCICFSFPFIFVFLLRLFFPLKIFCCVVLARGSFFMHNECQRLMVWIHVLRACFTHFSYSHIHSCSFLSLAAPLSLSVCFCRERDWSVLVLDRTTFLFEYRYLWICEYWFLFFDKDTFVMRLIVIHAWWIMRRTHTIEHVEETDVFVVIKWKRKQTCFGGISHSI